MQDCSCKRISNVQTFFAGGRNIKRKIDRNIGIKHDIEELDGGVFHIDVGVCIVGSGMIFMNRMMYI